MADKPEQPWMPSRPESVGASDRWVVLLVLGFCSLGVMAAGAVAFAMYWFLLRGPNFTPVALESRDEKRASVAAAFAADELGVDEATLAPIRNLFDRIQACSSDEDFRKLVHADRFYRATIESDAMPPQPQFLYERYRGATRDSVYRPWETVRYRLRRVQPAAEGEYIAYGYFWDIHGDLMEMRWWLIRDKDTWKVYDWELLQVGMRRSRLLALYYKGPSDSYNRFYEDLNTAYASLGEYDEDQGRAALLRAERWLPTIPDELRAEPTIWAAMYWCSLEEYDEAVRVASLLPNPDDVPGVAVMRLMQAYENEQHERVLEYCDALEAALGPTPNAAQYRAEALDKLGRRDEATTAIGQLLRLDSASATSLGHLALSLSGEHIKEVVTAWDAAERPANSRQLADTLIEFGDLETARALVPLIDAEADRSYVLGLCAEAENDDLEAARLFLEAMQQATDSETATTFRDRYLGTMLQLGRIVEAYQSMPEEQADGAFFTLLSTDEDTLESYLPEDQLRALLEVHAERGADDPLWHMASGDVSQRQGDLDAAVAAYERGLALVDIENDETGVSWMLPSKLRSVRVKMPEGWRIAFAEADDPKTAFAEIASSLAAARNWDSLAQLIETYAAAHPDDVMGEYYRGQLLLERGNPAAAEACLARAQSLIETPPDEWNYEREQFRGLRVRALLAMNHFSEICNDATLGRSAFSSLVGYLREQQREDEVADLARQRRQNEPHDPAGWEYAASVSESAHDDAALAELLAVAPWSEVDAKDLEESEYDWYSWRSLGQQRFRCLLRLGRFDEAEAALKFLEQEGDEDVSNERIMLSALRGDIGKTRQLLADREPRLFDSPFEEGEAADLLWGDAYRDLREEHPPQAPAFIGGRQWVLLLEAPRELTTGEIEARVTESLGADAVVSPLEHADADAPPAWLIRDGSIRMAVCVAQGLYTGDASLSATDFPDAADYEVVRKHTAWIEVAVLSQHNSDAYQENARAARLLGALGTEGVLALYDSQQSRLFDVGVELDGELARDLRPANEGEAALVSLIRGGDSARDTMVSEWLRRPLKVLALKRYRGDESEWHVNIRLACGTAAETLNMVVEKVEPNEYGGWTYIGRLTNDSQMRPRLRSGERLTFTDWMVRDWTLSTPEGVRRGHGEAEARWDSLQQATTPKPESAAAVGDSAQ